MGIFTFMRVLMHRINGLQNYQDSFSINYPEQDGIQIGDRQQ
jgi:hypothetical protein